MKSYKYNSLLRFLFIAFNAVTLASCQDPLPAVNSPGSYIGGTYGDIFEGYWSGMNTNYVFWDIDKTNWDQVYSTYKPKFQALGDISNANNATAEQYFTEMTTQIIDSHYTLTFELTGNQVSPALNRKLAIDKIYEDSIYSLPDNFFSTVVKDNYLETSSVSYGVDTISLDGSTVPLEIITGRIAAKNSILYFRFNTFAFSETGTNTTPVLNAFFDDVKKNTAALSGIIIDVRENGGGEVVDVSALMGALTTSTYTYGYAHSKAGTNRLDYTALAPATIRPVSGAVDFQRPIVVLVDHLSVSASELTTLAVKALPHGNGKIIGTTTWGANGPLLPSEFLNGGQFTIGAPTFGVSGYMYVYTSSEAFVDLDHRSFEGVGIPPQIFVVETAHALNNNIDLQLQKAIEFINAQ